MIKIFGIFSLQKKDTKIKAEDDSLTLLGLEDFLKFIVIQKIVMWANWKQKMLTSKTMYICIMIIFFGLGIDYELMV